MVYGKINKKHTEISFELYIFFNFMKKSIKFKLNSKVDVFKNDDQELFEQVKTGLVVVSHLYGYVFVAYKNGNAQSNRIV